MIFSWISGFGVCPNFGTNTAFNNISRKSGVHVEDTGFRKENKDIRLTKKL
jgi:hypothetical protein